MTTDRSLSLQSRRQYHCWVRKTEILTLVLDFFADILASRADPEPGVVGLYLHTIITFPFPALLCVRWLAEALPGERQRNGAYGILKSEEGGRPICYTSEIFACQLRVSQQEWQDPFRSLTNVFCRTLPH